MNARAVIHILMFMHMHRDGNGPVLNHARPSASPRGIGSRSSSRVAPWAADPGASRLSGPKLRASPISGAGALSPKEFTTSRTSFPRSLIRQFRQTSSFQVHSQVDPNSQPFPLAKRPDMPKEVYSLAEAVIATARKCAQTLKHQLQSPFSSRMQLP